eukprot:2820139-Pyramimonas_sp.AAC.1
MHRAAVLSAIHGNWSLSLSRVHGLIPVTRPHRSRHVSGRKSQMSPNMWRGPPEEDPDAWSDASSSDWHPLFFSIAQASWKVIAWG